jgi:hypothetical protein
VQAIFTCLRFARVTAAGGAGAGKGPYPWGGAGGGGYPYIIPGGGNITYGAGGGAFGSLLGSVGGG